MLQAQLYHNGQYWQLELWESGKPEAGIIGLQVSDSEAAELQLIGIEVYEA